MGKRSSSSIRVVSTCYKLCLKISNHMWVHTNFQKENILTFRPTARIYRTAGSSFTCNMNVDPVKGSLKTCHGTHKNLPICALNKQDMVTFRGECITSMSHLAVAWSGGILGISEYMRRCGFLIDRTSACISIFFFYSHLTRLSLLHYLCITEVN